MVGEYGSFYERVVVDVIMSFSKAIVVRQAPSPVSWNGQLIGHVVSWREVGGSSEGRMAARGWSAAALTVVALRSGARYAVTVRSYNRAGAGPHSPVVHGATPAGGEH